MAVFEGLKAEQQQAGKPHIFSQSAARVSQAILEIRNGPAAVDRVFRMMEAGQLQAQDGSAAAPVYSFESDPDTGMYDAAANRLAFAAGGSLLLELLAGTGILANAGFRAVDGSVTAPSITFKNDPDSGLFSQAADAIGISVGGVEIARIEAGLFRALGQVVSVRHNNGASGTVNFANGNTIAIDITGSPTLTFASEVAGGFYTLELIQPVGGGETVTYPANVVGLDGAVPPQPDTTANRKTLIGLYYDGTDFVAVDGGSYDPS